MNDKRLKQAILFAGAVSWLLGKKALEAAPQTLHGGRYHAPNVVDDPAVQALQAANGWVR